MAKKFGQEKPGNARTRSPRFLPGQELIVNSKTIGTSLSYKLKTEDVSETGLLLCWEYETQVPFLQNTLVEMEIDPTGAWLDEPLLCVGKVVRKFGEVGTKFGIVIVQMDGESISSWENCVGRLQERAKDSTTFNAA